MIMVNLGEIEILNDMKEKYNSFEGRLVFEQPLTSTGSGDWGGIEANIHTYGSDEKEVLLQMEEILIKTAKEFNDRILEQLKIIETKLNEDTEVPSV